MAKNCKYYREKLSGKLDGELTEALELEIGQHLSSCEDCANFYAELEKTQSISRGLFARIKESADQDSLWESIASRIALEPAGAGSNVVDFSVTVRRKRIPAWVSSAAAAVLVLLLGFYLYYFMFSKYSKNNCIVTWVESKKNPVMLYKDKSTNTTIIWMFSDVTNS